MTVDFHNARFRGHAELGFYQTWRTQEDPHRPVTAARYCECGTRLRRTKSAFERFCDACDLARHLAQDVADLHPATHECADCRAPIYHQSTYCRTCVTNHR